MITTQECNFFLCENVSSKTDEVLLLSFFFFFLLQRRVRGILCDVWVAERGLRKGQYSTVEIYFSHENWTVEVEVFNKVHQVPIGISSYVAVAVCIEQLTFKMRGGLINEIVNYMWRSLECIYWKF